MSKKKNKKNQCSNLDQLKSYRKNQEIASKLALTARLNKKCSSLFFKRPVQINHQYMLILIGLLAFSVFSSVATASELNNRRRTDAEKNFHDIENDDYQYPVKYGSAASVSRNSSQVKPAFALPKQHFTASMFGSYIFPSAKSSVAYNAAFLTESKTIIKDALMNLMMKKNIACKINSLFEKENANFRLYIGHDDEMSYPGAYNTTMNFIILKGSSLRNPGVESLINHELHHAFVCYQNIQRKRVLYLQDRETKLYQEGPVPIPCEAGFPKGQFDCNEFKTVWSRGYQKIHKIMSILERYDDDNYFYNFLSKNDKVLLDSYLALIENYDPVYIELIIPSSANREMESTYHTYKDIVFTDEDGVERQIREIKKHGDSYIAYVFTSLQVNARPLTDLLNMIERYKDKEEDVQIIERDAVIHQLYELTPELMEFLFEGINKFHQKRSSHSYQICTGYSEYGDTQQPSFKPGLS